MSRVRWGQVSDVGFASVLKRRLCIAVVSIVEDDVDVDVGDLNHSQKTFISNKKQIFLPNDPRGHKTLKLCSINIRLDRFIKEQDV